MTYHRTAGKGGTRNSKQGRHPDKFLPNHNKTQGSGKVRTGKEKLHPNGR